MVLNATFNNISVLLVEETGVPGENHQPVIKFTKYRCDHYDLKTYSSIIMMKVLDHQMVRLIRMLKY